MSFVPYNSRDIRHKSVFGALQCGQGVWFSVCMPRDFGVTAVYLVAGEDGCARTRYPLEWKSTDNITEWWSLLFSFDKPGLYYYSFEYESPYGTGNIRLEASGMGALSPFGSEWQQTVYMSDFKTPEWIKGGVMYQIFPDRFCRSGIKHKNIPSDRILVDDWSASVKWQKDPDGEYRNNDWFGGDLKGIESRLAYLSDLGVTCIYLNPVFEAHSNHRYNTADYSKIDPSLGTNEDFEELAAAASSLGIRIILDGVFSHTGDDSIYFNKTGRYGSGGAYNSKESEYYPWYTFYHWNDTYASWWGFETLPEVNEENEEYSRFITGEGGIIEKWLTLGASGFRLDVADELPDSFIEKIRDVMKRTRGDALLIGEVWEDASCKISYGGRRRYFSGKELDSVMNYPFREAIIDFSVNGRAENFMETVVTICENYPKPVLDCLMNSLSTHDTERILSVLGGQTGEGLTREAQSAMRLSSEALAMGLAKLRLASVLQYTLPGVPCVYYGDEALMQGLKDPFNRAPFPWGSEENEYSVLLKTLAGIRKKYTCLSDGEFVPVSAMLGCVAYERKNEADNLLVIANANPHEISYYLPYRWHGCSCLTGGYCTDDSAIIPAYGAVILFRK